MEALGFMLFLAAMWAWFWPEETGEWIGKIAKGYRGVK